jgi:hypothetical protein
MSSYHQKKPYSPSRQIFPRRFLEPWRILVAVVVVFLLFFFRFDATTTPVALSTPSDILSIGSQKPVGFRPLNESKIAIVTFHTDQKSYTHLSLKNKFRKTSHIVTFQCSAHKLFRLCESPQLRLHNRFGSEQ